jgi:hypothetical protein
MAENKVLHEDQVTENRFRFHQLMFRVAGCPIFRSKESKLVFALSFICFYMNFVAILMDTYVNIQDMERAMEDVRLAFPIASGLCIHQFMRYGTNTPQQTHSSCKQGQGTLCFYEKYKKKVVNCKQL